MDSAEVKALIDEAVKPLLERITVLEADNL